MAEQPKDNLLSTVTVTLFLLKVLVRAANMGVTGVIHLFLQLTVIHSRIKILQNHLTGKPF